MTRLLVAVGSAAVLALTVSSAVAMGRPSAPCPQVAEAIPCCAPPVIKQQAPLPCCPLPTVGCCSPVASTCCAATPCTDSLSISAAPDPASYGDMATISGTLTGATVAAQSVSLWQRLAGEAAFSDVAQTQTDSSGAFRFMKAVHTNAEWYVQTASTLSSTMTEPVRAAVVLHTSRVRRSSRHKLRLSGRVAPSHAGERVALEQRRGHRWVTIARPILGARSSFTVTRRVTRSAARFRVVLAADARNSLSVSAVVAVTRRR